MVRPIPDELSETPANISAIFKKCFGSEFDRNAFFRISARLWVGQIPERIIDFFNAVKQELDRCRNVLRESRVKDDKITFSEVTCPAMIVEAFVHALYSNEVAGVGDGPRLMTPEGITTYIKVLKLADEIGFDCVRKTVIANIKDRAPYLLHNTRLAFDMGAQLARHLSDADLEKVKEGLK